MVDGLVRFDSAGLETARVYSPHTLEHSWVIFAAEKGCDRICVYWRGVVSVEKRAHFWSGGRERRAVSEAAAVGVVWFHML